MNNICYACDSVARLAYFSNPETVYTVRRTYAKGNDMSISPEAAEFLNKLRDDTARTTILSQQLHHELSQKVHKWLDATLSLRIAIARTVYAQAQLDSLQDNPVDHYAIGFPQFDQWLINERRMLLCMSEVKSTFGLEVDEKYMFDMMDAVRSKVVDYDLPGMALVDDGQDVIVCFVS